MLPTDSELATAPLIICASERRGNSLDAATMFAGTFASALKKEPGKSPPVQVLQLNRYHIAPCTDCGLCAQSGKTSCKPPPCPHQRTDDSAGLFERLIATPLLVLVAPIYFYHLPARLKALIDRCQYYYNIPLPTDPGKAKRKARVVLFAGRPQGEQLFTGSLLSLKYALSCLNFSLDEPLLMRGIDQPEDFRSSAKATNMLQEYALLSALDFSCNSPDQRI